MASQLKKKLSKSLPGEPSKAPRSTGRIPNLRNGDVLTRVTHKELKQLLGREKYPALLDFSPSHFQLEGDQFLSQSQNIVKELYLSSNSLSELSSIEHLSKLKVLAVDKNQLTKVSLRGLAALEYLSLAQNRLTQLPPLSDLKKLVHLDLSGNRICRGFEELAHLKSLAVLDFGRNSLDLTIQQFNKFVLGPLRRLPKLTYLSFAENPLVVKIVKFKLFVISELPRLKYLDWKPISKEERHQATKLQNSDKWKDKDMPAAPLPTGAPVVGVVSPLKLSDSERPDSQRLSNLLGTDDSALVNFLLGDEDDGDDALDNILADLETPRENKTAPSPAAASAPANNALDEFLNDGGDGGADPLADIIDYLETGDGDEGAADENYDDELMRIIYGTEEQPPQNSGAPAASSPSEDQGLDSLLEDIISSESVASEQRDQEEQKRKQAELDRMESKKQRELQAERARIRAELEAEKRRELEEDRERQAAQIAEERAQLQREREELSKRKQQMSPEDEALAILDGVMDSSGGDSDADAVLAMIDSAVSSSGTPVTTRRGGKPRFGPRGTPGRRISSSNPLASRGSIRSMVEDDDEELAELLQAQESGPKHSDARWMAKWRQIKLGERLGVGTFGSTYRGWWQGSEVTVKKLKVQRFADAFLQKAAAEVPALMKIKHINVVPFLGWCQDNTVCTLQGYVRGTVLWGYLRNNANQVDLPFIVKASRGVASGLRVLHNANIIHRNLHSKNVLLDGQMQVKLRDYGMAFVKRETYSLAPGPTQYEAPELLQKALNFTSAVDVYALGTLMWEMWTRSDPWRGKNPPQIKQLVLGGRRPEIMPDISAVFQKLIMASWNEDAARRPNVPTIQKILSKDISELGSYGGVSGTPSNAAAAAPSSPADGDKLDAPSVVTTMEKLTEKIVGLLQTSDQATVERGLRVILNLVGKPEYAPHTASLKDLVPHLVQYLRPGTARSSQELALSALCKVCTAEECADEFRDAKGFPALVHLITGQDRPLQISSSKLLTVLISKSEQVRDNLSFLGVIPCLVQMIKSDNDLLKTNAVWALSIALENTLNQDEFLRCGGVAPLLRQVQSPNPGIVMRVLVGVGFLVTNLEVFHKLKDSGVVQRFIKLLSSPTPLLQKHAVEALARFSENAELRVIVYRSNGLTEVMKLLSHTNSEIRRFAVETIGNYAGDEEAAEWVADLACLKPIVKLMVARDASLRLSAVKCLVKAAGHAELAPQIRQFGAVGMLVQLINATEPELQKTALQAIVLCSRDADSLAVLSTAMAHQQVVRVMQSKVDDKEVQELGAEVLGNLAQDTNASQKLRDSGAVPLLVDRLGSSSTRVSNAAALALVFCSTSTEGRAQIHECNGVEPLLRMLSNDDESVSDRVFWSVPNFAADFTTAETVAKCGALAVVIEQLPRCKESLQSVGLKTILVLAQNSDNHDTLRELGAIRALQHLGANTSNGTISLASERAISLLS